MCGIFGIITKSSNFTNILDEGVLEDLFILSESRGKESSGVSIRLQDKIIVLKTELPASEMIHSEEFKNLIHETSVNTDIKAIIGHTRLVTNGAASQHDNNQPVIKDGIVGVHNGIITNNIELWENNKHLIRKYDVDTEILLSMIQDGDDIFESISKGFGQIEGTASVALLPSNHNNVIIATNNGSLYTYFDEIDDVFIFASEEIILKKLAKKHFKTNNAAITKVSPNQGYSFDIGEFKLEQFNLTSMHHIETTPCNCEIVDLSHDNDLIIHTSCYDNGKTEYEQSLLEYVDNSHLKRCTKCVLPETFPGIKFDDEGVCNLCRNHKPIQLKGKEELKKAIEKYKNKEGGYDCLIGFSGGRDSSYGLHYIKSELGMNPLTFTYDWGMVTDLARRNIARVCGRLGVENILISADIKKKRENIRKNIIAWLKKPDLGMVPLFMAGDKQFFYYANKIMKENNIKLTIFCENIKFEKTEFKTGFCGLNQGNTGSVHMNFFKSLKIGWYCIKEVLKNPAYINSSLFDSIFGFFSTYMIRHDYIYIFDYIDWEHDEVVGTIIDRYNWETATDTKTTWRIGDGTASFYNYIYYTVAGFNENDTFRSNQIRNGIITREEALELIKEDNKPRYESIKWYCDIIGLDYESTIKRINAIPKLKGPESIGE